MVIELGVVLLSIIPATIIGAIVAQQITDWPPAIGIGQMFAGAGIGLLFVEFAGFPMWLPVATAVASQTLAGLVKLTNMWHRRQRRKALGGDYGEVTQWAAEIAEEGDREFVMALNELPDEQKREIGIIAESKEELRELVIERLDEITDDTIPEDFA